MGSLLQKLFKMGLGAQDALTPANATGTSTDCFKNGAAVECFQKCIVFGLVAR
jgi:hypothetical protein